MKITYDHFVSARMPILTRFKFFMLKLWVGWQNLVLTLFKKLLFSGGVGSPDNILIYKTGHIGDTICAVPAMMAVRRQFPEAHIILLTSPGSEEMVGAEQILEGAKWLDDVVVYYQNDLSSWENIRNLLREIKEKEIDLFVQLPEDLANARTLLRNMFFAKMAGASYAIGFKVRTSQLFKKTQVDYSHKLTEVESLVGLLSQYNIGSGEIEFDLGISGKQEQKAQNTLEEKWPNLSDSDLLVGVNTGSKRPANRWPKERYAKLCKYLQDEYSAKAVFVGGPQDREDAEDLKDKLNQEDFLVTAGDLTLLESIALLDKCSFVLANSTGTIHMAASQGNPAVGFYTIRDVPGRWSPYGNHHKILYHTGLGCNYRKESCIKRSADMITLDEAKRACDNIIKDIKNNYL